MPTEDLTKLKSVFSAGTERGADGRLIPPAILTSLSPAQVVAQLDLASRRGRLPGFQRLPQSAGLFRLELHGKPFDGIMIANAEEADSETRLKLTARMLPHMPVAFGIVLIATVWPGIYFMDRLIPGEWSWIPRFGLWWPQTWWWYIPLTALPLPFAWRILMRRSREALDVAMQEAVKKVTKEIDGRIE